MMFPGFSAISVISPVSRLRRSTSNTPRSRRLVLTMIWSGVARGTDTMLARTPSKAVRSRAVPSPGTSTIITWWFSSPPWSLL